MTTSKPTLSDLPQLISLDSHYTLQHVLSYSLCPGNPDLDYVELIDKECGEFKVNGKVVASLYTSWEFTTDRHAYDKAIRARITRVRVRGLV